MSSRLLNALRERLREERGLTLVELLIAMVVALVISVALLAIVIVSVHLSSNYTDRVDANQQGRLAMEKITQSLYSSCVTPNQAPVQAGSNATSVTFYSATNDLPGPVPSLITISIPSQQPGPLSMITQVLSGTPPFWTTTGQFTNFTLAPWAAQTTLASDPTHPLPLFQYYGYGSSGVINSAPFNIGPQGLTPLQAAATTMVRINYQVLPTDAWAAGHRPVDFTDSVIFRVSPPSSVTNATNLPCL